MRLTYGHVLNAYRHFLIVNLILKTVNCVTSLQRLNREIMFFKPLELADLDEIAKRSDALDDVEVALDLDDAEANQNERYLEVAHKYVA